MTDTPEVTPSDVKPETTLEAIPQAIPIAEPIESILVEEVRAPVPMSNSDRVLASWSEPQALADKFVASERTQGWLVSGVVILLASIGTPIAVYFLWPDFFWIIPIVLGYVVAIIGLVWLTHFLPAYVHETTRWKLDETGFEIRRGVWWRHVITIPRARVQHTDVAQGPFSRQFGLAKLVIHTAGTATPAIELAGLKLEVAHQIRDSLIAKPASNEATHG